MHNGDSNNYTTPRSAQKVNLALGNKEEYKSLTDVPDTAHTGTLAATWTRTAFCSTDNTIDSNILNGIDTAKK